MVRLNEQLNLLHVYLIIGALPSNDQYNYYEYTWPFGIYGLYCNDSETSIWDCSYSLTNTAGYSCSRSRRAAVKCQCKL